MGQDKDEAHDPVVRHRGVTGRGEAGRQGEQAIGDEAEGGTGSISTDSPTTASPSGSASSQTPCCTWRESPRGATGGRYRREARGRRNHDIHSIPVTSPSPRVTGLSPRATGHAWGRFAWEPAIKSRDRTSIFPLQTLVLGSASIGQLGAASQEMVYRLLARNGFSQ